MVLNTEKKAYLVIREVLAGEANDVYILSLIHISEPTRL